VTYNKQKLFLSIFYEAADRISLVDMRGSMSGKFTVCDNF